MELKNHINKCNNQEYARVFLIVIFVIIGTSTLFSQQVSTVTFVNPFNFGDIVITSPGTGSVTLTTGTRTTSGNVIIIPSRPGTTSLASFVFNYRGNSRTISWGDVIINPINIGTFMTVSDITVTSSLTLPRTINNNTRITFNVTSAKLNINTAVIPTPGLIKSQYTVTILGTQYQ